MSEPDFFTRPTDPDESRDAAGKVNVGKDREKAFALFSRMIDEGRLFPTRTVFQFDYLPGLGYSLVRSKSLCRRVSDLTERKNNPFPDTLWLFISTGRKFKGAAIMTYTMRGVLVQAEPGIMTGLWGQKRQ